MIKQKLQAKLVASLKAGNKDIVTTLRYILAQIKNKEIDKKEELTDEEAVFVLRKIAKELKESVDAFIKGERNDLREASEKQLQIISAYLPKEISDEELKAEVEKIISQNQEIYNRNQKAIIGICVRELKSKADPSRIIKILQTLQS